MEKLSIPEKKIAAKIMYKIGWGSRKIEQWLGLSDNTVLRSVEEPTPDNLKQFEAQFEVALVDVRREALALIHKRILEIVPKERKLDQLVKAGDFMLGRDAGTKIGVAVKVDQPPPVLSEEELAQKICQLIERAQKLNDSQLLQAARA